MVDGVHFAVNFDVPGDQTVWAVGELNLATAPALRRSLAGVVPELTGTTPGVAVRAPRLASWPSPSHGVTGPAHGADGLRKRKPSRTGACPRPTP
jgi:hypothetical protein